MFRRTAVQRAILWEVCVQHEIIISQIARVQVVQDVLKDSVRQRHAVFNKPTPRKHTGLNSMSRKCFRNFQRQRADSEREHPELEIQMLLSTEHHTGKMRVRIHSVKCCLGPNLSRLNSYSFLSFILEKKH